MGKCFLRSPALVAVLLSALTLGKTWRYRLLPESHLVDDCLICGRPTIIRLIQGSFDLVRVEENPLFARYELRNISFATASGADYSVTGGGTYQFGGEVAVTQGMNLDTQIKTPDLTVARSFTNEQRFVTAPVPTIEIDLDQTEPNLLQFFRLHLVAVPVRDIWFSTVNRMTAGIWPGPENVVTAGDLLSVDDHVVSWHEDLLFSVRVDAGLAPLGVALDALDVGPGGEIFFSLSGDATSTSLGELHHGDLLSDRDRVVKTNQELLAAFQLPAGTGDVGLDAVQVMDDGEILFSITTSVVSTRLGATLLRGDLLSDRGQRVKTNKELLANFQPSDRSKDYGLDAFYIWPGGEIWFSTEVGFQDAGLGTVRGGDLLSTRGRILFNNLDLVSAFQPLEELADFGLDALFIVTDGFCPAAPPRLRQPRAHATISDGTRRWEGSGRAFQIERADDARGPFAPVCPIVPGSSWTDVGAAKGRSKAFYRVRQW